MASSNGEKPCVIAPAERGCIAIRGARQNNLKGFDLDLPLGELTVVTGPSGSGKSSLAFDTIYAEGQRRYVETFSPYTRQFLDRMDKPRVDEIRGIPPAIAIEQSNPVKSSRSSVGTMTEINDYLKLLMPRVAHAFCPSCGREIRPETANSIADEIVQKYGAPSTARHPERSGAKRNGVEGSRGVAVKIPLPADANFTETPRDPSTSLRSAQDDNARTVLITFWVAVPAKTPPNEFFQFIQQQGYLRVWLNGEVVRADTDRKDLRLGARVQVIQDRLTISSDTRPRLIEALETALRFGKDQISVIDLATKEAHPFSTGWHCAHCDLDIRPPTPGLFSFNNPLGACPECRGFGRTIGVDYNRAIPDRSYSIAQGAVRVFRGQEMGESQKDLLRACAREEIDINTPFEELPQHDQDFIINGEKGAGEYSEEDYENDRWYGVRGFFKWLESKTYKMHVRVLLSRYRAYTTCPSCQGGRFQPETLNYRLVRQDGIAFTLPEFDALPISEARDFLTSLTIPPNDSAAEMLRAEIVTRLSYLCEVGVGYLALDRSTRTLSGGEVQRVNLTTCLGASLVNTLFVMDEPSVGLHPRDVGRLVRVMHNLRDKGNTLLVVEHEEAIIRAADQLLDIGPGRGERGGELVFQGSLGEMLGSGRRGGPVFGASPKTSSNEGKVRDGEGAIAGTRGACAPQTSSLTADYLSGRKSIPIPDSRRKSTHSLKIKGAREHNLQNIDVEFPLGVFTCVTGVSGSGKSTLVHDVLYRKLLRERGEQTDEAGLCKSVTGQHRVGQIVMVDQAPLSRTPRSTPILYLGVYDRVRELFAALPEAMAQGLTASAFSFNSGSGRCERCGGTGFEKIEMQFLSDLYVRCAECEGRRFQPHVLKVKLEGKSIHDVLTLTVSEAIQFFTQLGEARSLGDPLAVLDEVGLGYLQLGQPLNTLSGGESQRLKLVRHLTAAEQPDKKQRDLFIFDEPTTGLHFDDVALLVRLFQRLVEAGNSVVVIEHNLEVMKCADWIIDLGPEGGEEGGKVVAVGTPEEVAAVEASHTGKYLRKLLVSARASRAVFGAPPKTSQRYTLPNDDEPLLRAAEEPFGEAPHGAREAHALPGISPLANGSPHAIAIHGAREHNLKNISLTIPRDQMVVITGLSGSGKSTVAFDLLFAEGQRRFLDSMSPYARQFVEQLEKPDVDLIEGLPPTVAIEQRVSRGGGKSTVATVTEVYHFLRLLFAKTGTQFCPDCDLPVEKQSLGAIVRLVEAAALRGPLKVLAPLVKARKGFHTEVGRWAERQGFDTLYVDRQLIPIKQFQKLERFKEHTIDAVVGGIDAKRILKARNLVQRALQIGRGTARLLDQQNRLTTVSTEMSCPGCGRSFEELDPRLFSFNSPHGWCETCNGFGEIWNEKVQRGEEETGDSQLENELNAERQFESVEEHEAKPCPSCHGSRLNPIARHVRLQGKTIDEFSARSAADALALVGKLRFRGTHKVIAADLVPEIEQRLRFMENVGLGYLALGRSAKTLSGGESQRIRLAAQLGSNLRGVLYVLDEPTIGLHARDNVRLLETLTALREKGNSLVIVEHDEETMRRADHIIDLGPGAGSLGGEVVAAGTLRDIREVTESQTGRCLREPLAHPMRKSRRSLGDVAHWLEIEDAHTNNLQHIDVKFPIGRLSVITGISGSGKSTLMRGVLLPAVQRALGSGRRGGPVFGAPPKTSSRGGKVRDGEGAIAGTRGAGAPRIFGADAIEAIYEVDQSPIGKTSRSTPATYIKVLDEIRELFAQLPVSRVRGYSASRFSFNTDGGRCETCSGQGVLKLEMSFLPSSYVPCEDCGGKRYNAQTLEVLYHDKSIGDVMEMTIGEAAELFAANQKIARPLSLLGETGLGYLKLGQPSPTLSGGEAQRLKLATKLTRGIGRATNERLRKMRTPKSTLYLIEEPTIGLHMADVELLLRVLHRLVDDGNTVIVIEHNMSVIAEADYVVDIGPEAGSLGGQVVAVGTPEEVAKNRLSRTAPFLREVFGQGREIAANTKAPRAKSRARNLLSS
ncbi:MAG: ATP-binding cassette domain-containing protein [Chthoniobacterales bacterium]|nr:ATP-binding cassette domain-containing protein [Chthoniobacterales bacterium]